MSNISTNVLFMYVLRYGVRGLVFGIFIPLELYEKSLMVKETPRKGKLLCCTLLKKNSTMNQHYVHCFFFVVVTALYYSGTPQ